MAPLPSAGICVNKSRLKIYHKETNPTYYLSDGQEFSIELNNPTQDIILAKIVLNGKEISQGGLVLRPAERVFLERYIDVAKKFKFETYTVSNTAESKAAIENNGDIVVRFYKESLNYNPQPIVFNGSFSNQNQLLRGTSTGGYVHTTNPTGTLSVSNNGGISTYNVTNATTTTNVGTITTAGLGNNFTYTSNIASASIPVSTYASSVPSMDWMEQEKSRDIASDTLSRKKSFSKKIETGRVEAGSDSGQKFEYVRKTFQTYPFHTVEYKLLPVSNKVNTVEDINVKTYCHNCGAKNKPEFKFCPVCGQKI